MSAFGRSCVCVCTIIETEQVITPLCTYAKCIQGYRIASAMAMFIYILYRIPSTTTFFDIKEQVNMYNKNLSSSLLCCLSRAHPLLHVSWQEQSGERSQISWGYSAKRWKTNVIARLLIITYHFPYNIKIYSSLFRYVYFITRFSAKYFERCCWRSMCIRGVCNRSSGIWNETVE